LSGLAIEIEKKALARDPANKAYYSKQIEKFLSSITTSSTQTK
jgi:hypothetical protein